MRNDITVMALIMALMLFATGCAGAGTGTEPSAAPVTAEPTVEPASDPLADYSVTGPWGLSTAKNDMAALYTVFGTSLGDYGSGMEIKSSGEMEYFVGATGGSGTYTRDGGVLTAQLTDYNEGKQETLELRLVEDGGAVYLTSVVYDTTLYWTQNEEEQAAKSAAAPVDTGAYDGVLESYRSALSEKYDDVKLSEAGLNYMLMFFYEGEPLNNIGYCLQDIGGDGSPELLIAPVAGDEFIGNIVFDMYTLVDGKPVQLFSAGERDRYYMLNDGTLYNEGSMSAAESVYRQLTLSGGALSEMTALHFNGAADSADQWSASYWGSEPQSISETDANGMISTFQAMITKPEYTPFGA